MDKSLEEIIKSHIHLKPPSNKGWQAVRCHVCNDHTRKGLRGAFKFESGIVNYKCWNCNHASRYDPEVNEYYSKNMITTLDAFGIPENEYKEIIINTPAWINGPKNKDTTREQPKSIEPTILEIPKFFYYLKDAKPSDDLAELAIDYLQSRDIDHTKYPYMLARETTDWKLHKWLGRVIIPIYKNNKLVYYIGRALYDAVKKYETPAISKENILYGFDKIFDYQDKTPLLVVEGYFDAVAIDGIGLLGNIITEGQRQWLNRSPREKIYIPDRFGNGMRAANQALDNGWSISTPDIGSDPKDMDDAVKKYGKLYIMKTILEHKADGELAKTYLGNYCIT